MHIINDAHTISVVTSTAEQIDYSVSYVEIDTTNNTIAPDSSDGSITTATTTDILAAAGTNNRRQVKTIILRNSGAGSNTVTLLKNSINISPAVVLSPGEMIEFVDGRGFRTFDTHGREKNKDTTVLGYNGLVFEFHKIGTASEAAGVRYGFAKDSGFPGAWVPGSPGLNGWWVDASQASNAANPAGATQAGCVQLPNPASGAYYLVDLALTTSVAHLLHLLDLIWYNTGLVVTTTTAQTITQPAGSKPARDLNGSTNGEGWGAAIYVTTATTNGAAVTNTTISYTNSDGTAGRTGTINSFPQTAVAGTFVPIQLAAGDRGIRSVESVTLGTSYGGGAISLVMYRMLASVPNPVANVGGIMNKLSNDPTGVRIYNGTALWPIYMSSATTATTLFGTAIIAER